MQKSLHNSGIYIITNCQNGRVYIGQSKRLDQRLGTHKKHIFEGKHPNAHLNKDLQKYDANHFKFAILERNINHNDLNEKESDYIRSYYRNGVPMYNIKGVSQSYVPRTLIPRKPRSRTIAYGYSVRKLHKPRKRQKTSIDFTRWFSLPKNYKMALRKTSLYITLIGVIIKAGLFLTIATVLALLITRLLGF